MPRANSAAVAANLQPQLVPASLPYEHLSQLSKRLASLLRAVLDLQAAIQAPIPLDDWPNLLAQHLNLLSSTHSLSSMLLSPAPTHAAQTQALQAFLQAEAVSSANIYAPTAQTIASTALGLAGSSSDARRKPTAEGLPLVRYADPTNLLPRLAAHPIVPLDAERSAALGNLLRTRLEPDAEAAEAAIWQVFQTHHASAGHNDEGEADAQLRPRALLAIARRQQAEHDEVCGAALRSWYHLKEQPDEEGERYDWKLRIAPEELADLNEEDDEEMKGVAEEVEWKSQSESISLGKRKRGEEEKESMWSTKQVLAFMNGRPAL